MMEVKVNVDGVERSVSGLTESTTCAQIIYALAHATGQKGRFVLVEKYRDAERSLAPSDRPLEMLRKWDQHSQHVSFVLKHLDSQTSSLPPPPPATTTTTPPSSTTTTTTSDHRHQPSAAAAASMNDSKSHAASTSSSSSCDTLQPSSETNKFSTSSLLTTTTTTTERSGSSQETYAHAAKNNDLLQQQRSALLNIAPPLTTSSHRITTSSSAGCISNALSDSDEMHHTYEAHPSWQPPPQLATHSSSSSYLGISQTGSLKHRPPPPAYHEVIERRYNSLSRGATTTSGSWMRHRNAFHSNNFNNPNNSDSQLVYMPQSSLKGITEIAQEMNLSSTELERLVLSQQRTIEEQKAQLAQLDIAIRDDDLREIIQLERQQANLRLVLNPLRSLDWPSRLQAEKLKVEQVEMTIVELQRKIDCITSELREKSILEVKISEQIDAIQKEIHDLENGAIDDDDDDRKADAEDAHLELLES